MDQTLFEWLKNDIKEVKDDMRTMNEKVDQILQFKWQIVGGSVVISAVVGILIQFLLAMKL